MATATPAFHPFRSEAAREEYVSHCRARAAAWPVAAETCWVDTRFGRTLARVSGRASDPPLILLPGGRVSSLMWRDTIATLSAHHRTYALDIVGDAGFSVSTSAIQSTDEYADWLHEVAAALVPTHRFSLLGVSLGGAIAGRYAMRHAERLRALVLIAPAATVLPVSVGFFLRFTLLSLSFKLRGRNVLRGTFAWLFADAFSGDEACRARVEQALADAQLVVRVFRLPHPPWPASLPDEVWRGLRLPCLFLAGENEKLYSARAAVERLRRVAPGVIAEIVPGCGHDLTLVHPDRVAKRVVEFLAGVEREG
jgi:pimeloyl-ACP methyl ester carboxylesterase